jgi:RNA polymerase sigma factor (sigma-70 family)
MVHRTATLPTTGLPGLVSAAAQGDDAAWDALHSRYDRMLRRVARGFRLSDADVEDVLQETWMRLLRSVGRLEDPCAVGAWLCTTARRESLRALQRATHEFPTAEAADEETPDPTEPDDALSLAERAAAMLAAIDRLPNRQRTLMHVLLAQPLASYEDVGRTLGMPVGSIGPTRQRAVARLRDDADLGAAVAA